MGVRNTSRKAFHSLDDLGKRQRDVLNTIWKFPYGICNLDISIYIEIPINQITPRTNELVNMGLVEESHRARNVITGRQAIYWKLSLLGEKIINSLFI